jgi:outer membrane protein, heavy metal efflux system
MSYYLVKVLVSAALIVAVSEVSKGSTAGNAIQPEPLTLERALEMAERLQPELAEARALIAAAEGRAKQAGAFPNPDATVRSESVGSSRNAGGVQNLVGVSQAFPIGGRLRKAREVEELERGRQILDLEMRLRDLQRRVHSAFAEALYQEKALETRNAIANGALSVVDITAARLDAGDIVPEDLARAEMELAQAEIELRRAKAMREHSLVELRAAIGDPSLIVGGLSGSLDETFEIPALESLAANLSSHPGIAEAEAVVRVQEARIDLAKVRRIPDVRVESLYRRLQGPREDAFDIGFSVSIPLFDRRRGRLQEVRAEAVAAEARYRSVRSALSVQLQEAHAKLASALANSRALKTEVLPRAEIVMNAAESRFQAGDISLAKLLPVRREWAEVQFSYVESLGDVMQAWADLTPFVAKSVATTP